MILSNQNGTFTPVAGGNGTFNYTVKIWKRTA